MNRDGVRDGIYVNFFGFEGKAAMLACDMYGILPENLLYLSKNMFLQTGDESEQVLLVRYTMCERSRQGTFRTLLGAKSKLIAEGHVEALWKERCRTLADATPCPRFTKKQLEEAATALDTDSESDEERQVDERGLRKPPPPRPPASPFASDDPGGEAVAEAAATENDESPTLVTDTPFGTAPDSELPPPPPPTQASSDVGGDTRRGSGTTATNDNAALAVDAKRMAQELQNDWKQYDLVKSLELPRTHKLRPQPPSIPQAYFPRLLETLNMEEKELAAAQKKLSRYSKKAARQLRARQQERSSGPSAPGRTTPLPTLSSSLSHNPTATHLLQSVKLRNRRELAVVHRVVQVQLRSLSERYEQGRSIDEKMEGVPTLGTLEHMLKYQKSIGIAPEFEDRVQAKMEREESRAALQQQLRASEWERAYAIDEKAQHAKEVLERERERTKGIAAEAHRTQRLITEWKHVAAHRQHETHLNSVLHRSAVRHAKADTYIEKKRAATGMLRYYHDQQEVHRRQLRDTIRDMMISKKISADEVAGEDDDVVA